MQQPQKVPQTTFELDLDNLPIPQVMELMQKNPEIVKEKLVHPIN